MGRHADAGRTRGVARWVITAVVVVVVLAAITVGYLLVVNRSDSTADGLCTDDVTLAVAAGPGAAPALTEAAADFTATGPVARSSCVTVTVTAVPDDAALTGLTGDWPADAGSPPGMWVPDNRAYLAALDAARPDLAAGHPSDPVAWSPVVLAVRTDDVPAVSSLSWSDLPAAAGPTGTAALPGGRHLLLALPPIDGSRATSYAVQSMLAEPNQRTPVDAAVVRDADDRLRPLATGAAGEADSTARALTQLAGGGDDPAPGAATAVPVVEADLVAFDSASASDSDGGRLAAVHPDGPTAGDELITAPISATWADETVAAAASKFEAFLADPAGQRVLADHGWRTTKAHAADPIPGVDTTAEVTRLPAAGPALEAALATSLGQPEPSQPVTTGQTSASGTAAPETSAPDTSAPTSQTSQTTAAAETTGGTGTTGATSSTGATGVTGSTGTTGSTGITGATTSGTATSGKTSTSSTASSTAVTSTSADPAASGPVLTIIVDSSQDMADTADGRSLLDWVKKALPAVTGGKITNRVGLWAYSDSGFLPPNGYPQLVSTGPLTGTVDGTTRAKALKSAITGLQAQGDRWAYGALIEALPTVQDAAVHGRDNRVVLITSGVDQTPATPRQMVLDAEAAVGDSVRIDVIGLGDAVPVEAYQDIAQTGGGEYIPVPDPSDLRETLTELFTLEH